MEKIKQRDEIEEKYKWDLKRIYKTEKEFNSDLNKAKKLISEIPKFKGKLFSNSNTLEEYLMLEENLDKLLNKLYLYSHLQYDEEVSNTEHQKTLDQVMSLYYEIQNVDSFFDEEFFKEDYSKLDKMLDNSDFLKKYKLQFERQNRYREHFLDSKKEKLVSKFSKALDATDNIYNVLSNSEIKFDSIKDENGKDVEITDESYSVYIKSHNRKVRRDTFKSLFNGYANFKNTISSIYMGNVDSNIALSQVYKFKNKLENHLFPNNISLDVYNNLIKSVNEKVNYLQDYYKFKKEALNLDEFHIYDTYVELVDDIDKEYSYEQAKDKVMEIIKPLGEDYKKHAEYIFENKLIDVMPNIDKRSGAYSSSTYDTDPYMLLNFKNKYYDISVVAHELGHSIHSMYSKENNSRLYYDYAIFVAEVASTVNEHLLALHEMKYSNDKKEKLSIMNGLLDNYKATIYRQTMFAEFEQEIYRRKEEGESLTNKEICDYYLELNKKYFGDSVIVDDEIKYEWERIPHFYTPFYVFTYATSMSAAIVIANKIFEGDKEFRDKYIKFLSLGSSMYPTDELKTLGIDMTDGSVVSEALEEFNKLLNEFKDLYNEVYNH